MKNVAVLIAFVSLPFCGWAQSNENNPWLEQGQFQIGLGVGAGVAQSGWTKAYIRASPYAQYFLKDGLALRLEGRYNYNGSGGDHYAGVGLLAQYHLIRTNRFSTYLQAGYFYGRANYSAYRVDDPYSLFRSRQQYNYGMLNVGLGAQYRVSPRWSINALAEKNLGQRIGDYGTDKANLTLGVNFRLK
jgi:hypothetical protein